MDRTGAEGESGEKMMRRKDDPYIVEEGIPWLVLLGFLSLFTAAIGIGPLAWPLFLLTLGTAAFFRNPARTVPPQPSAIVSPADGRIIAIEPVEAVGPIPGPFRKISIFMSILDVHVNRMPVSGTVVRRWHTPGRFRVASRPEASGENERLELIIETDKGLVFGLVQVAGLVARRIVCYPREGDRVERGERFGMIRFGSRVELYVPEGVSLSAREGQRVRGGETVVGYLP